MRKKSIEEDSGTPPPVASSNRLSRFLPSCKCVFPELVFGPYLKVSFAFSCNHFFLVYMFLFHSCFLLQRFCTKNTVTSPSTGRSRGNRGRSWAQRRRGSETRGQTGPRLHLTCLHPAPFVRHEARLLLCGRTYLTYEPAVSLTISVTRRGSYRR